MDPDGPLELYRGAGLYRTALERSPVGKEYGAVEYGTDGCGHRMLVHQILLLQPAADANGPDDPDADRYTEFSLLYLGPFDVQFLGRNRSWPPDPVQGPGLYGHGEPGGQFKDLCGDPLRYRLHRRHDGGTKNR